MSTHASEAIDRALDGAGGVHRFRAALAEWFRAEARDYPWRRTRDPYAILVSEAMLQQTQIATVLGRGYYERWMKAFPDWENLAAASEEEVLKQWEGLGYYNRARNLQKTARIVARDLGGRFPGDVESVLALPGVGRYTAGAVLSFAFGQRVALVDGNVARVLARVFLCPEAVNSPAGLRLLWDWAEVLLPEETPGEHNSALMELGQRICRPASPGCPLCPLRDCCLAHKEGKTDRFPVKLRGAGITNRDEYVILAVKHGRIYLCPETGTRRRGLWRLPEIAPDAASDLTELFRFDYPITRYRVTLRVHEAPIAWVPPGSGSGAGGWFAVAAGEGLPPLGAPYRKALGNWADLRDGLDFRG